MHVARGLIRNRGSIIAQPLKNKTLRRPELLPELLVRRRAILAAIRARSSCCIQRWQGKLRSQSLAWHSVAGFCLRLFPCFRKTSMWIRRKEFDTRQNGHSSAVDQLFLKLPDDNSPTAFNCLSSPIDRSAGMNWSSAKHECPSYVSYVGFNICNCWPS